MITLTINTKPFCAHLFSSKLFNLLTGFFSLVCYTLLLVRPNRMSSLLGFYDFAQSFRLQVFGVLAAEVLLCGLVIMGTRQLLTKREQRRIHYEA